LVVELRAERHDQVVVAESPGRGGNELRLRVDLRDGGLNEPDPLRAELRIGMAHLGLRAPAEEDVDFENPMKKESLLSTTRIS
jgi:hypothetical protein